MAKIPDGHTKYKKVILSPRDIRMLSLIRKGEYFSEISKKLKLSSSSVAGRVTGIRNALKCKNTVQMIGNMVRDQLIK